VLLEFKLLEEISKGKYRILAGEQTAIRFKQKFDSGEFDLSGLNCTYDRNTITIVLRENFITMIFTKKI
jgi:hypothetical protein